MSVKEQKEEKVYTPKYAILREQLRSRVMNMKIGEALPTIAQIREEYNLSQPTVDRAIQELRTEGLLVTKRGSGIFVSGVAKNKRIGVVFSNDVFDSTQPVFYRKFFAALQDTCRESNKLLSYYINDFNYDSNEHNSDKLQLDFLSGQLDGLIVIGYYSGYWERLVDMGLPMETFTERNCSQHVCNDYSAVIKIGTKELVDLGCSRIALWHSCINEKDSKSDEALFYETIACSTAMTSSDWIIGAEMGKRPLEAEGYRQFKEAWDSWDIKPDGIVCTNDNHTIGILRAADELGIKIPGDLNIATMANMDIEEPQEMRVTRIEYDANDIVKIMLKRLEERLNGRTPKPDIFRIKPSLVKKQKNI